MNTQTAVNTKIKVVDMAEKAKCFSAVNLYLRNAWYHQPIKQYDAYTHNLPAIDELETLEQICERRRKMKGSAIFA